MHINEDHFLAEIIDPDTGEVLPEGEKGELVFTCLDKEAFPVLRSRTRDICVLTREKCSCGRTFIKMAKPMGRSDDMMIIRGVNVFPSQIETVLVQEGFTANYLIKLGRKNNNDTFDVFVELPPEQFDDSVKVISDREKGLQDALRTMLGISPAVHLVPPKTIARSEGKAVRIIDERKLHD
jgi:phenylacetate-CoA ligase